MLNFATHQSQIGLKKEKSAKRKYARQYKKERMAHFHIPAGESNTM
jgi:hypothetical protein